MPRLRPQSTAQSRVTKRVEQQEIHDVFTSGEQVLNSLRVTDVQQLVANLIKLRNQWTIRNHELGAISSDDTRLLVAKDYLARSPSAAEVFSAWELLSKQSIVHQHLALGVFASLINLLSTQYAYHNLGLPIVKTLLSPTSSRRLNSHLNSAQTDLVLVALKVWNALSDYGGGMEKLKVYEQFMWSNKSLFRLFHMRRKGQIDLSVDPFIKPDIRTLYIMFLLSFVRSSVAPTIKATFLETQREILLAIFKRISEDPYPLVKTILEVSWEGIWRDNKIKRTVKIGLFGEQVLSQLTKLYARASLETPDPESKPADVVHHFLLAICTKPGIGICFKDNGWYPRDTGDDQDAEEDLERPSAQQGSSGSKIYNRILGRFIKTLRPTEDAGQQELALRILQACPELVAGYFAAIGLSFEPRLSSKWIIAMSWLGSVISLSIPTESFSSSTGNTQEYHSAPPPLLAIMDNVLPSPWSRTYITKGLQSTSSLVQHTTALCLIRAINKFDLIIRLFKKAEEVLAEDPITGQWALRRKEMEKDFRRRTPPFEVIVTFAQQKASNTQWGINVESLSSSQALRGSMTTEAALRLMWLYYKVLPDLPLEARYDVSKLLHGGVGNSFAASLAAPSSATRGEIGFDAVCQLHVLRLLQLSDQFIWHTSTGDSQQTQLRQIIHLYMLPTGPILSETCSDLLRSVLAPSPLFEHDPQELNVWLEALPRGARRVNAKDPDGAALADERDTMSLVLDQCIRTCIKSPWRYIEAAQSYYLLAYPAANSSDENHKEALEGYTHFHAASPLLVALLDTFGSILSGSTDSPTSAALAIVTYLRQVILGVSIKQPDEQYAARVANRLERAVSESDKSSHSATLLEGISREIRILRSTLPLSKRPPIGVTVHEGPEVADFLDAVESLHIDPEKGALMAYELVDWVRLSDQNLSPNSIQRAVSLIRDWHPPAMRELLLQLDPSVTPSVALIGGFSTKEVMAFPWLLFHASSAQLHHDDTLELLSSVGARCRGYATQMSCAVLRRRVDHLAGEGNEDILVQHILLWSHILMKLKDPLSRKTHQQWALESDSMQSLLTQGVENGKLISAISFFIQSLLDETRPDDRELSRGIYDNWLSRMQDATVTPTLATRIRPWVRFMTPAEQLRVLEATLSAISCGEDSPSELEALLHATFLAIGESADGTLLVRPQIPRIFKLLQKVHDTPPVHEFLQTQIKLLIPSGITQQQAFRGIACDWTKTVEQVWETSRQSSPIDFSDLNHLDGNLVEILVPLVYKSHNLRALLANRLLTTPNSFALPALLAVLEAAPPASDYIPGLVHTYTRLVLDGLMQKGLPERRLYEAAFKQMMGSGEKKMLEKNLCLTYTSAPSLQCLPFLGYLSEAGLISSETAGDLISPTVKPLVGMLAGKGMNEEERQMLMRAIAQLSSHSESPLAAATFDAFFTVSVQDHIAHGDVMTAFRTILTNSRPKPATVNRLIQALLHHPQFEWAALSSSRDELVAAIHSLFLLHPQNTCQPSQVSPLINIYRGSLEDADLRILDIFRLFEVERRISVATLLSSWSPTASTASPDLLTSISQLDPDRMFGVCLSFPQWRSTGALSSKLSTVERSAGYDPLFIILLLAQLLAREGSNDQLTGISWVQICRTNILAVLICSLSARDDQLRNLGWTVFGGMYDKLEHAPDFFEKKQLVYLLEKVARLYVKTSSQDSTSAAPYHRLPSYTTLFFAHAFRSLFAPSSSLYPLISRFVLQRPEFDPNDPPMLYSMLYSTLSSDLGRKEGRWKRERNWMLRFLSDGMVSSGDWKVLQRRHTWDLLATNFQMYGHDRAYRVAVLKILSKLTKNQHACTTLVTRHHLLPWIIIQLGDTTIRPDNKFATIWHQIIENIVVNLDQAKANKATEGKWCQDVLQCIIELLHLHHAGTDDVSGSLEALSLASRTIQCLADIAREGFSISMAVGLCFGILVTVEQSVHIAMPWTSSPDPQRDTWVEIQKRLWLALMGCKSGVSDAQECWERLTARLVAYSGFDPEDKVCEWAKVQTIECISSSSFK